MMELRASIPLPAKVIDWSTQETVTMAKSNLFHIESKYSLPIAISFRAASRVNIRVKACNIQGMN